jgi:hypothetical protein
LADCATGLDATSILAQPQSDRKVNAIFRWC